MYIVSHRYSSTTVYNDALVANAFCAKEVQLATSSVQNSTGGIVY
jgi:hypothetical protein